MGIFDFLKPKSEKDRIIKKYYSNYPEQPYISEGRDFSNWEKLIAFDPTKLVNKDKMLRNPDGLLPGHVYQLYWIDKYNSNKKVPVYFEYEFGINFQKEKLFLEEKGFLTNYIVTKRGIEILKKYSGVIENKNSQHKLQKLDLKQEVANFDKRQKRLNNLGIESSDKRDDRIAHVLQNNAIVDYQNKNFDSAKHGFLEAINKYNFYTPGGVDYLAKIYRKEKDYQAEIDLIEKAIAKFNSQPNVNWSTSKIEALKKRLIKARELNKR